MKSFDSGDVKARLISAINLKILHAVFAALSQV